MRILFDKNVPVGVRGFLPIHEVRTFVETQWPDQLKNGELLTMAEQAGFDVMVTSDQNIRGLAQGELSPAISPWLEAASINRESWGQVHEREAPS